MIESASHVHETESVLSKFGVITCPGCNGAVVSVYTTTTIGLEVFQATSV
jgi:hypothetical protein